MEDYQNNEGRFSFIKYLNYLNMFLIENVIKWSEKDSNIRRLLTKAKTALIYITVDNFRIVFCDAFSLKEVEIEDLFISFEIKLVELYQRLNELLLIYYKIIYNLIKDVSVKDRLISTSVFFEFNSLKSIFLNIILRAFIRDLIDFEIRKKVIKSITQID